MAATNERLTVSEVPDREPLAVMVPCTGCAYDLLSETTQSEKLMLVPDWQNETLLTLALKIFKVVAEPTPARFSRPPPKPRNAAVPDHVTPAFSM